MNRCSKKGCEQPSTRQMGCCQYCNKHYRFKKMRSGAQQKNKYMPSWEELSEMLPKDMICNICNKQMIWHKKLGKLNDVISLQHDNNGDIRLICFACNIGHRNSKLGDEYFNIQKDHKYCPECEKILSIKSFYKNKSKRDKHNNICKKCVKTLGKKLFDQRRDKNICINCGSVLYIHSVCRCYECFVKNKRYAKNE